MCKSLASIIALVACAVAVPDDPPDRVKKQFRSDSYKVTWKAAPSLDPSAVLEVGSGSGHGQSLTWQRFQPVKGGVEVLNIMYQGDTAPYRTKWPPDTAPVTATRALMKTEEYAVLLADLAAVSEAELKQTPQNLSTLSSNNFWVQARLTLNGKVIMDLDWAGYDGSDSESEYAKPLAAVNLARDANLNHGPKPHSLTEEERRWASTKFIRDWKKSKPPGFRWWVVENSIVTIGVVGDATVLPTLVEVLNQDQKKPSESRQVYYAINAVTRLTGKDVRERPVETMDLESTRLRVLSQLKEQK